MIGYKKYFARLLMFTYITSLILGGVGICAAVINVFIEGKDFVFETKQVSQFVLLVGLGLLIKIYILPFSR